MQHETLPATLHFKKLNPHMEQNFPVEIPTGNIPWKRGEDIRRAAVSSFGFSGTNAHVILEEGPELSGDEDLKVKERLSCISPFQRKRYWAKAAISNYLFAPKFVHPLLGCKILLANGQRAFNSVLNLNVLEYMKGNLINNEIVFPEAAIFEMLLAASKITNRSEAICLRDIVFKERLLLNAKDPVTTQVLISEDSNRRQVVNLYAHEDQCRDSPNWVHYASANIDTKITIESKKINPEIVDR